MLNRGGAGKMPGRRRSSARLLLAAVAAMTVGLGGSAQIAGAANTPDPFTPGNTDLSNPANYATPPGTTSDVEFTGPYAPNTTFTVNGSALNYGTLNDLDTTEALTITNTSTTAGSITLNTAANSVAPSASDLLYVASGGNLTLQSGTGTTTLNIGVSGNIDSAGTLNLNGPIALGANTLTFTGAGATTIRGVISGTGGLTLNDAGGSVTLTAANPGNTLTGAVVVNAGTLFVNANANAGNGVLGTTSSITINSGGTISILDGGQDNGFIGSGGYGGKNITVNAGGVLTTVGTRTNHLGTLILAGGTLANSTAVSGAGTAWGIYNLDHGVISGGTSVTSTISAQDIALTEGGGTIFNVASGTTPSGIDLNVTGTFFRSQHPGDTGLIKTGNGVMALAGANTYQSNTTVSAGTLMLDFTQAGAPASNIINNGTNTSTLVMNGGTLLLNGNSLTADSQRFNGLSVSPGASSIVLTSNGQPILLNVGAMTGAGGTVDFTLPAGAQTATNGIVTTSTPVGGIFAFATVGHTSFATVNASGDIVPATLTSTNVPSGGLIPNTSTANIQIVGGIPGAPTGISGSTTINSLTDNFAGPVIIDPGSSTLTVGTGGVLIGAGAGALALGTTPGVGTITAGTGGTSQLVLNNSSGNNLMVNSVVANNGAGVVSLAASGTGSVTLNAANTFGGDASAGAAGLILANSLALQNANYASANIIFSQLVGSNAFTVGGLKGNFAFGLTNNAGAPVALTFGGNGQSNTFSGVISGAGSLTKVGGGTETLGFANTFTGGLIINGGTVVSTTSGGASSLGAGTVTVNAGGILQGNAQDSFGFTTGVAPGVININGGTVQENATGAFRQTLPDLTFSNGGTLTGNGNTGDANGNFSFRGNPANGGNTDNITVLPSATTATINATAIWMQAGTVNFNVGRGTAPVDLVVNASLINGGNLTKLGKGIMSLTRQNTFTGLTSVNGGTLMLDFSASGAPSSNILPSGSPVLFGGGTLLLNGGSTGVSQTVSGVGFTAGASGISLVSNGNSVMISYGFTERRDTGATVDYTPPSNNTGGSNGIWTFDTPGSTNILGGYATVNGSEWATVFDPNAATSYIIPLPLSSYTLVGSGGTIPDNALNNIRFTGAGTIGLANGSTGTTSVSTLLQAASGAVTIDVGGNGGAAGGGTLNIGADYGGALGASGGILSQPGAGPLVLGTAPNSGTLTGQPGGTSGGELIFINNSANSILVNSLIADPIGSTTSLTKAGSGLLIVAGTNTYTGQTTIGAGTLQVGNGGATGQLGTGAVVDNGALVFNTSANQTVNGINGSGSVTQNGTGTITLTKAGNFSGGLVINGGTVVTTTSGGTTGIGGGPVTVNAGATLQGNAGDSFGFAPNAAPQVININGGTVTEGAGAFRITLPNLVFSNGGTLTNPTGTGGNTGDGNGNYSLFGVNGAANITVNPSANTATISATRIGVQNNLTLNVSRGTAASDLTISSILQNFGGTRRITVTGNGITTLSGNNTFSGGLFINGGTVISTTSGGGTGLGAGPVTVYSGATLLGGSGDSFGFTAGQSPAVINIAGGTVSETAGNFRVTLPNIAFLNGGTVTSPAGAGDGTGNYSFFGGTVTVNAAPVPAVISATQVALQAGTVNFNVSRGSSPTDLVVSSVLAPFGGTQGIAKNGTGVMSLTAPNTYTGTTAVNAGVLLANNLSGSATGTGAVAVNAGGTLAGTGTISGPAAVNAGGTISAGDAYIHPGQLALTGATTLASGSGIVGDSGNGATYLWKMNNAAGTAGNSSGWDNLALNTLSISGSGSFVTIEPISVGGGFLNTPAANFVPGQNYTWKIATLSGGGGAALAAQFHLDTNALSTFASTNNTSASYFAVTSDPNDVYISYTPTPEPTSLGLVGLGAGGLLLRRRRNRRA